ncbi:hypothetical protein LBMAG53_21190 [Planctomycetota bacterium]|nr:hypothetical protein LBMAG53_21190 [Planctomycetota bacterium]
MSGSRWWRKLGILGAGTAATLAALLLAVAAADRSRIVWDQSADHRFSLDPALVRLVEAQVEPVRLVAIWDQPVDAVLGDVTALCRRAVDRSPSLSWQRIDPELHKPLLAEFEAEHGPAAAPALWLLRGKRSFRIPVTFGLRRVLQRELGGALATLADPNPPLALVLHGHGELRPDGGELDGAQRFLRGLTLAGWRVALAEVGRSSLPPASLVIVPGPTAPLGERDLAELTAHARDGGGILVLADDRLPADLHTWLRRRGLTLGPPPAGGLDAMLAGNAGNDPPPIARSLGHHRAGQEAAFPHQNLLLSEACLRPHPALGGLGERGVSLLSPFTVPVLAVDPALVATLPEATRARWQASGALPATAAALFTTWPGDAWMQLRAAVLRLPEQLDPNESLPLAAVAEYPADPASARSGLGCRIAVWGSRQAASDGVLALAEFANGEALSAMAAWAGRRAAPADIPPAEIAQFQVKASEGFLIFLLAAVGVAVPCCFIGVAMLLWWDRR